MRMKRKPLLILSLVLGGGIAVLYWCSIKEPFKKSNLFPEYANYQMYAAKNPFHVLVDKGFPSNKSALFVTDENPVVFSFDQLSEGKARANVSLSPTFSAHVGIDSDNQPSQLSVLMRMPDHQQQFLQDLDLNGVWDIKLLPKENKRFIFINGTWLEVDRISGVGKSVIDASSNGHTFRFDRSRGVWEVDQEGK